MKYTICGEKINIDDSLNLRIGQRLSSLGKHFVVKEGEEAIITVKPYGNSLKYELSIELDGLLLRSEIVHDDLYSAVDLMVMKLEDKIRRHGKALVDGHKDLLKQSFSDRQHDGIAAPVCVKEVQLEELCQEEAILRMEMSSHSFYVYRDLCSKKTAVVYKRNDGNYGLLEIL